MTTVTQTNVCYPYPHFAKPEPIMGQAEGWQSDAAGATLNADQQTSKRAERDNGQTE